MRIISDKGEDITSEISTIMDDSLLRTITALRIELSTLVDKHESKIRLKDRTISDLKGYVENLKIKIPQIQRKLSAEQKKVKELTALLAHERILNEHNRNFSAAIKEA